MSFTAGASADLPVKGEDRAQQILQAELGGRRLDGWQRWLVALIAVSWSVWQMYATWVGNVDTFVLRATHLAFAFALVFLVYPAGKAKRGRGGIPWYDAVLAVVGAGSAAYVAVQFPAIATEQGGVLSARDVWVGSAAVLLLLVAAWRSLGLALLLVALSFILYAATGPRGLIEGDLGRLLQLHAGFTWPQITGQLYGTAEGIFGSPIGVSATIVFLFVLFGAMFDRMGAGDWFMHVAQGLLGGLRGGPAKAAVVSSGLNGIVSGSAVSNVVTGGHITISTMKRVGYSAEKAGGIEVAASSNGQLMPPVMGAAAFIMAEYLGIPYAQLITAAALPALLCYATLFVVVHIEALKLGLRGLPRHEIPPLAPVVRAGWYFLIPIAYLLFALTFLKVTPERAALNTIGVMVLLIFAQEVARALRSQHGVLAGLRSSVGMILGSLETGARNMVGIAIATAASGIIVGLATATGIGFGLSDIVSTVTAGVHGALLSIANLLPGGLPFTPDAIANAGQLLAVLIMAQLVCLVLGIGLPTTANYIVMASLVVPVMLQLAQQGGFEVPPLAAHMFVFYFGIMADSTPPVALAAFAAAAISGGDATRTGWQGFVYEMRTALLAYMMFFNPQLLLIGVNSVPEGIWIAVTAFAGLVAFSAATLGFLHRPTGMPERAVLLVASILLIIPGFTVDLIGFVLLGGVYLRQKLHRPAPKPLPSPQP